MQEGSLFFMPSLKTYRVLGLSSDSSLEGLTASVIVSDGVDVFELVKNWEFPFDDDLRENLYFLHNNYSSVEQNRHDFIETQYNDFCLSAIKEILSEDSLIDLIAFGGHTINFDTANRKLYQLGDASRIAWESNITTIGKFEQADILSGGLGGPISAIYHACLSQEMPKPIAWVDIDGISTLTYIGQNGEIIAFDCGGGVAIINDWVYKHANMLTDYNGKLAISGNVNTDVLNAMLKHKFLLQQPPKVASRSTFCEKCEHLEGLSLQDGTSTATAFIANSIIQAITDFLPEIPKKIIICGKGVKNPTLMRFLRQKSSNLDICNEDDCNFNISVTKAQAFGFLAARRCNLMPTAYPFISGTNLEVVGGEIFEPKV